jgi:uncharacterized protein YdcH (DUF465 family)
MDKTDDHKTRLFDEYNELGRKIEKLKQFIVGSVYDKLPDIDKKDLKEQLSHMEAYNGVLSRRTSRLCDNS